jgi:predicted AlkP superfamily pyrophosphatase or phosphodiesterase
MAHAERVILLAIDGLRPDALPQANPPTIGRLIAAGAHTKRARSVIPSISLPCWVSVFYGVPPSRHGVVTNVWSPPQPPIPGLIDVVHEAGLRAASFYNWEELRDLSRPGSLDLAYYRHLGDPEGDCDLEIGAAAAAYIPERRPALTFIYLGALDEVGHRHGWMSAPYLHALGKADRAIGLVCEAMERAGLLSGTAFFVLSDHGGHGHDHGKGTDEDLIVPWIASGPGIRRGQVIAVPVGLVDTAPTVAHLLGLPRPAEWSGRVVTEALAL